MIDWDLIPCKVALIARVKNFTTENQLQEFCIVDGMLCAYPDYMADIQFFEVVAIRPEQEINITNALLYNMNVEINSYQDKLKKKIKEGNKND